MWNENPQHSKSLRCKHLPCAPLLPWASSSNVPLFSTSRKNRSMMVPWSMGICALGMMSLCKLWLLPRFNGGVTLKDVAQLIIVWASHKVVSRLVIVGQDSLLCLCPTLFHTLSHPFSHLVCYLFKYIPVLVALTEWWLHLLLIAYGQEIYYLRLPPRLSSHTNHHLLFPL